MVGSSSERKFEPFDWLRERRYCCLQFCFRMTKDAGVTLIPVSAFYDDRASAPRSLVRFVTCKTDAKLEAACAALERYFGAQREAGPRGGGGGSG